MINGRKIIAIIPARGGSKGIPKKNIKIIAGKPLIAWTIEEAKKSKYIDRIILSSDDSEIIEISKNYGCEVPFVRPKELALDTTLSVDVILHAIENIQENYDICIMLEPTSPLRDAFDIDNAFEIFINTPQAESIVGISKVDCQHPVFLVTIKDKFLQSYLKNEFKFFRRQDIEDLYFFEGSFYISFIDSIKNRKTFYHEKCIGYEMPKWKSFEVDDEIDLIIIENLLTKKTEGVLC